MLESVHEQLSALTLETLKGIMHLRKLISALLVAGISTAASAVSLGEGIILSHVGEPFAANVALIGSYNRDVRFYQVKNAECRSSIIGSGGNGCDSLYEGALTFSVRQRRDGQYFLSVTGEKGSELYYRILIKSVSPDSGTVFNTFEFLPEFKATPDVQVTQEAAVDVPAVEGGESAAEVTRVAAEDVKVAPRIFRRSRTAPEKATVEPRRSAADASLSSPMHLQIKKTGGYSDDIHALQKENVEIEEQIVLLEKHIALLKEVIRLKRQVDAASVSDSSVVIPARKPVHRPLPVQSTTVNESDAPGLLSWILLAAVLVLSGLLIWMYFRKSSFKPSSAEQTSTFPVSPSMNERKSLDLTDAFIKPRW